MGNHSEKSTSVKCGEDISGGVVILEDGINSDSLKTVQFVVNLMCATVTISNWISSGQEIYTSCQTATSEKSTGGAKIYNACGKE